MKLFIALNESFSSILKVIDKEEIQSFLVRGYENLNSYHLTFGQWIRNEILSDDSLVYFEFVKSGITNKDDMSDLYLKLFYCYCCSKS